MGYDIHGWVGVEPGHRGKPRPTRWIGVIKIDSLIPRYYDPFACLFGVGNWAHFRPIAAGRGLPSDISEEAERDYVEWSESGSLVGESWITWSEVLRER
ncbi:MAG TPA: hypothetical protein VFZ25_13440 [Chloroflexota bacterium]|nr:hypothetical protein [Chloroflexota bacterium]